MEETPRNKRTPAAASELPSCLARNAAPDSAHASAESKYARAVALYASSTLPCKDIAALYGLNAKSLSSYICRCHRDLLFLRHGVADGHAQCASRLFPPKGQRPETFERYHRAIEACQDLDHIELSITQIARLFHVDPSGLGSQLRTHFPNIIPSRNALRMQLGLSLSSHTGARQASAQTYAKAVEEYANTDATILEISEKYDISPSGLKRHLGQYHHALLQAKERKRKAALRSKKRGAITGSGTICQPRPSTEQKYAPAVALARSSSLSLKEIAESCGLAYRSFMTYLRSWHRDILAQRRCGTPDVAETVRIQDLKRRSPQAEAKYADAIASLRQNPRSVAPVARQFGLNVNVFRTYLRKHHPDLAEAQGMARLPNGNLVSLSSWQKYRSAVEDFASSSSLSLKDAALRHGLVYNSLNSFVHRNFPELLSR